MNGQDAVQAALTGLPRGELLRTARRLLDRFGPGFDLEMASTVADALEPALAGAVPAELAGEGPALAFVRARVLGAAGRAGDAEAQLDACIGTLPRPDATVLAMRARSRARRGDVAGASRDLRLALHLLPGYGFYVRAERVIDKVASASGWERRKVRIALLGSSTTALLAPVIRAGLFRDRIAAEIHQGSFGAFRQEILDPASALYRFAPEYVVLLVNHRDLALPPDGAGAGAQAGVAELRGLWQTLQSRLSCRIIQANYDVPAAGAWGALESILPGGRRRAIAAANAALTVDLPPGVSVIDVQALPLPSGARLASEEEWHAARQYPAAAALPTLADAVAAHVRAGSGLASKVLVLDLDNTLWGGVIGEDGIGGIRVGPPTAAGEAYRELQEYARDLRSRGVVLAVCSKNNAADARAPFLSHDGMALKLDDFAAFVANWENKATNMAAIAKDLSLGLDSFVFLDDSPLERALVRERLPDVIVPEVDDTPWSMVRALRRGMYFEATRITAEDLERNQSYRANLAIHTAQDSGEPLESFLESLGMVCEHGPVDETVLERVTQLVNKTNQFNVTTRRYNEEQVRRVASDPAWWCHWFRLSDRFGDHGIVGLLFARRGGAWAIDTWLMSCRVLGRRLEDFMCGCLLAAAAEAGAAEVRGEYLPTAKNEMVRDLFPRMGFEQESRGTYRFAVGRSAPPPSPFIRGVAREPAETRRDVEQA